MNRDAANNKDGGHVVPDKEKVMSTIDMLSLRYIIDSHMETTQGLWSNLQYKQGYKSTLLTNLKTIKLWCEESIRIDFDQKVDVFIWGKNWFFKV